MSGRGKPGGGLVQTHKPEEVKVTLSLRTTVSPSTVQLSSAPLPSSSSSSASFATSSTEPAIPPSHDLYIEIHASIKTSARLSHPVTLSTYRTPLERSITDARNTQYSPAWLNHAISHFTNTENNDIIAAPPELSHHAQRRGGLTKDLRESWDFMTIPSQESGSEEREVVVRHHLDVTKLRFWDRTSGRDVKPGEDGVGRRFRIGPADGGLGTFWWRWGDLNTDEDQGGVEGLKSKKFFGKEWYDGDDRELGESWVESEGENGFGLVMEVDGNAEVEFM